MTRLEKLISVMTDEEKNEFIKDHVPAIYCINLNCFDNWNGLTVECDTMHLECIDCWNKPFLGED